MELQNKNDRQVYFNQIKGTIIELNEGETYCSLTLSVGHENPRLVNFVCKKTAFDIIKSQYNVNDKVTVKFYITSRFKNGRYYTSATVLEVTQEPT